VNPPALSVVIVTDRYETIRKTVDHLVAQTIPDGIELVVVAPEESRLALDAGQVAGLHSHQVVAIPRLRSIAWERAAGIRAAKAEIVALGETHSYPEHEWAERLVAAHQSNWAAVGPAVENANAESRMSWANLLLDYGRWLSPTRGGEMDDLPGHNSSYKRELLLAYGPRLETMLEAETFLHEDLRRHGHRLYQEPRARISHLNVTRPSSWLVERFESGRLYAGARSRGWSPIRRAAYAVGSPLIPFVRLPRILGDARRVGERCRLDAPGHAVLVATLAVSALGELVGYATGAGKAMSRLMHIELHREGHLRRPPQRSGVA
jgi:hypothetical protein